MPKVSSGRVVKSLQVTQVWKEEEPGGSEASGPEASSIPQRQGSSACGDQKVKGKVLQVVQKGHFKADFPPLRKGISRALIV